jgi:hypothetical protein
MVILNLRQRQAGKASKSNKTCPKCAIWRPEAAEISRFSMVFQSKSNPQKRSLCKHVLVHPAPNRRHALGSYLSCNLIRARPNMSSMKTIGYVRVSTDKQADRGVSLEVQAEKIRAMAVVHNAT